MNATIERFANEAIFVLQFNSRDAVRYVQRNAGATEAQAVQAIKQTVTVHRHGSCASGLQSCCTGIVYPRIPDPCMIPYGTCMGLLRTVSTEIVMSAI